MQPSPAGAWAVSERSAGWALHPPEGRESRKRPRTRARPRKSGSVRRWLALGLDAVAHGAEACEGVGPLVARGARDNAQRRPAAEADPLHHRHLGLVLAADAVEPGLKARHAVDA